MEYSISGLLSKEAGINVDSVNEDGSLSISKIQPDGTTFKGNVDGRKLISDIYKSKGINYDFSQMPTTSAEAPQKETGLSFLQQAQLSESKTARDKSEFLKQEFGADNVRYSSKDGQFRVKTPDGTWAIADIAPGLKGFAANTLSQIGPIAGMTAGAAEGAALALPFAPLAGPFAPLVPIAGGSIGAGIGAVVGKATNIAAAHALGIRSDFDAMDISKELGKEFVIGAALEGAGGLAMAGLKATPALYTKGVERLGEMAGGNKRATAELMSTFNRIDPIDNLTVLEQPKLVMEHQTRVLEHLKKPMAERGVNPVEQEMVSIVQDSMEKAKQGIYKAYDEALAPAKPYLNQKLIEDPTLVANKAAMEINKQFVDMGLVDPTTKNFIKASEAALQKVVTPSSVNKLKKTYNLATKVLKGESTLADVIQVTRNLDELLEAGRPGSSFEIVGEARRNIVKVRQQLDSVVEQNLRRRSSYVADDYIKAKEAYSQQRQWLDQILPKIDDDRVIGTMKSLLGEGKNEVQLNAFLSSLKAGGINSKQVLNELLVRKAAINSAPMWSTSNSGLGAFAEKLGAPLTSPRLSTRMAAKLSPEGLSTIQSQAKAVGLFKNLSKEQRTLLLNNKKLLEAFMAPMMNAAALTNAQKQQLIEQGKAKINGQ